MNIVKAVTTDVGYTLIDNKGNTKWVSSLDFQNEILAKHKIRGIKKNENKQWVYILKEKKS